jgi:hypothetical protein
MCKRISTIALAFLLLAGIGIATPAMASNGARLTLTGPATVNPGDPISVVIGIENNPGLVGARLVIDYDAEFLRLRDDEWEEAYSVSSGFRTPEYFYFNNRLVVVLMRTNNAVDWTGETFITLVFTARKTGSTSISVNADDITNAALRQIENSGSGVVHPITITNIMLGDLNGDGRITTADVIMLLRAIAEGKTAAEVPAGDLNGDGRLTTADVTILLRHIAAGTTP